MILSWDEQTENLAFAYWLERAYEVRQRFFPDREDFPWIEGVVWWDLFKDNLTPSQAIQVWIDAEDEQNEENG